VTYLGDALVLYLRRVFKTAVYNSAHELGLKEKVLKTGTVNTDIGVLLGLVIIGLLVLLDGILFVIEQIVV